MKRRITAMLIVLAILLGMMPGTVYAANTISKVNLSLDITSIGLSVLHTEDDVNVAVINNSKVKTQGLAKNGLNSSLFYWHELYDQIYGYESGAKIKKTRQYYAGIYVEIDSGYDWPDEVKNLPDMEGVIITKVPGFTVIFNGEQRRDVFLKYNQYWEDLIVLVPIANDVMSGASVTLNANSFTYDGTIKKPKVKSVTPTGGISASLEDCEITCTDMNGNIVTPINEGKYYAVVTLKKGIYGGSKRIPFQINKIPNTMTAQGKTVKIKASKLKKKKQVIKRTKSLRICNAVGNLKFKLAKVNKKKFRKYFKVNAKNGNITIRKGLQKGKYKLKIDITAAGNANYQAATKQVVVTIKVK